MALACGPASSRIVHTECSLWWGSEQPPRSVGQPFMPAWQCMQQLRLQDWPAQAASLILAVLAILYVLLLAVLTTASSVLYKPLTGQKGFGRGRRRRRRRREGGRRGRPSSTVPHMGSLVPKSGRDGCGRLSGPVSRTQGVVSSIHALPSCCTAGDWTRNRHQRPSASQPLPRPHVFVTAFAGPAAAAAAPC